MTSGRNRMKSAPIPQLRMRRTAAPATLRLAAAVPPLGLGGCVAHGAPSFTLFGAYFPAWLLCAILGVATALAARAAFVATGLAQRLPFQFFVCLSLGVCGALLCWLAWFSH